MAISRSGNSVGVTIPAWLYELLPLIYITVGIFAAADLGGVLATLSGALLILIGIQILRMRSRYRESLRFPQRAQIRNRG